jgi:hypothetical protein
MTTIPSLNHCRWSVVPISFWRRMDLDSQEERCFATKMKFDGLTSVPATPLVSTPIHAV